jgi:hypothetical protein
MGGVEVQTSCSVYVFYGFVFVFPEQVIAGLEWYELMALFCFASRRVHELMHMQKVRLVVF